MKVIAISSNNNNNNNIRIESRSSRFLRSPHCAANCLKHARSSGQGAGLKPLTDEGGEETRVPGENP